MITAQLLRVCGYTGGLTGSSTGTKCVVARYFDLWNTGDASMAAEILNPDWVDHAQPEFTGL